MLAIITNTIASIYNNINIFLPTYSAQIVYFGE